MFEFDRVQATESFKLSIVKDLLDAVGDDSSRQGLIDTPRRVVRSWEKMFGGYNVDVSSLLTTFDEVDGYDQVILLKNIEFYSMCEHHMLPFFGKAHVAYLPKPGGPVVGISKLARVLEVFSRRLQIQERIGQQVTSALQENLGCLGAACILEAQHLCMVARGVEKQHSIMTTSSLTGVFRDSVSARAELFSLIGRS